MKALEKAEPGKVGIYNVGTGKGELITGQKCPKLFFSKCCDISQASLVLCSSGRSVKEFVEACKKATGVEIKVDYLPRRPGDYAEVYSDPSKINSELNWTARYTDLQESLKTAWKWQKAHREGYGSPSVMAS